MQGDDYLEDYRQAVGDDAFWTGLRQYYADYSFKIGGTSQLFSELDAASNGAAATTRIVSPACSPAASDLI